MSRWTTTIVILVAGCSTSSADPAPQDEPVPDAAVAATPDEGPAEEAPPVITLDPPPEGAGFQLSIEATAEPGQEVWICDVKPMPNEDIANVSWVDVRQNAGTHHLTLSTLGLSGPGTVPYGRYDCKELYGDSSLMEDQIMFFGNQGNAEDKLQLPPGVAATILPGLDVIHEIHYVNTSTKPVDLYSYINAWTIPQDEVQTGIWGGSVRDENIEIPPASEHTEWSRCAFNEDVEILFLASHTHALGIEFTIAPFDGKEAGEVIYTNNDWHTPKIEQFDPPIVVPAGQGFEWTCTWKNPSDKTINYGLDAADEMCNLAVVHTPFSVTARCEVVETSDGVLWTGE